ncbi:MAG: PRC-barrel domain-containing protein [Dethiobacteria bacterium]|jgi:sporulation protein YlmC with PRC-barrel domain
MRTKFIKGYPVVNLEDGTLLGRVQELIIDPEMKKVEGLVVGEKGFLRGSKPRVIPYEQIYNVGKDVLIIKSKEDTPDAEAQARIEASRDYSFIGSSVISSNGDYIAKVQDFTFSVQTGEIESLLLSDIRERERTNKNVFLSIEGVINLGKDYVIAAPEYLPFLREEHQADQEQVEQKQPEQAEQAEGAASEEALKEDRFREKIPPLRDILNNFKEIWDHLEKEISSEGQELARESREKMKKYILNKKANYTVKDNESQPLVEPGMEITEEILQQAEAQNKIASLFLAVISHELEESLHIFKEKLGQIFIK